MRTYMDHHTCMSADAYTHNGSADSHYVGAGDHERLERLERFDRLVRDLLEKGRQGALRLGAPSDDVCEQDEDRAARTAEDEGVARRIAKRTPWRRMPAKAANVTPSCSSITVRRRLPDGDRGLKFVD